MTRKRFAIAAVVILVLAVGGLLGGIFSDRGGTSPASAPPSPTVAADQALAGFSLGDTEGLVRQLQDVVRENPADTKSLSLLGLAYQQLARETGDPAYYTKSEGVLDQALALEPLDLLATSGLGSLALARHKFRDALSLGLKATEISPGTARNYGVVGDALVELGRYEEAFTAFDRLADLKPGLAAYSRVSYARELLGDHAGAVRAMELASDTVRGAGEPHAWTLWQLGKLAFAIGDVDRAAAYYEQSLAIYPDYVYALDALALAEAARGNLDRAIRLSRRTVDAIPLPQFVTQLGDLYHVAGQETLAREQYELMDAIKGLLVANGSKIDLETSVYYSDHGIRLREALELARAARADRPGIYGDDALAWALTRNGRCREALPHSEASLRLGTRDANLFFHRGMVERCLGNEDAARGWFSKALDLNPHFSLLWAPVAREAVETGAGS